MLGGGPLDSGASRRLSSGTFPSNKEAWHSMASSPSFPAATARLAKVRAVNAEIANTLTDFREKHYRPRVFPGFYRIPHTLRNSNVMDCLKSSRNETILLQIGLREQPPAVL